MVKFAASRQRVKGLRLTEVLVKFGYERFMVGY